MKEFVIRAFSAAVNAVNPFECVRKCLLVTSSSISINGSSSSIDIDPSSPLYLISFGKAAAAMTKGAEEILGKRLKKGIAIVPKVEDTSHPLKSTLYEAGRSNLPDQRSIEATKEVLRMLDCAERNAVFLVLISGGGSALLSLPSKGITLDHKLSTIHTLVSKGASIQQLNAVRRVLSQVKGGGLLERFGERKSVSLILSDIVGDPLEFIASGPTVHPQSSIRATTVIDELNVRSNLPNEVVHAIDSEKASPSVVPNGADHVIIGNNSIALKEAKNLLENGGFTSAITTSTRVGDAGDFGREVADTVVQLKNRDKMAILYGGETTVNLPPNSGKGGRNQHAALTAMIELSKRRDEWKDLNFCLLFGGTDGQDGTDAAGAILSSTDIIDMSTHEIEEAEKALLQANSYNFWKDFKGGKCHFKPGLTGTNVMDITIILCDSSMHM
ncbi:hypothetical protein PRIPAC_94741 [Pristionchus pacificus]|uniref:Uncharacterized protein n=1 Tax=Pristionchus pacificus TaxID=54126 RepID=A0A2A6B464_PRIPA|nr:hypothetical protein PRIPAC_94741 [Pristionchus pacificus]|eukprot:PDM60675.1 hypothetical protein PRIPAC_53944 [Pristionchus pacificus]